MTNPNYTAPNATGTMVISKGAATITLGSLEQTYDGSPRPATATTNPPGLSGISFTYDGSASAPTNIGQYAVVAAFSNPNYQAPDVTGTLTISQATATITLSNLAQTYDGSAKHAIATTSPAGLSGVSITYNGSEIAPTNAGSYAVVATLSNPNTLPATAEGTLVIGKAMPAITLTGLAHTYDGSPKSATATSPDGA